MDPEKQAARDIGSNREMITPEIKEITEKCHQGVSVTDLWRMYRKSSSTICTILKQKDKVLSVDPPKGVPSICKN